MGAQLLHSYLIECDPPRDMPCLSTVTLSDVGFDPIVERLKNLGWTVESHVEEVQEPSRPSKDGFVHDVLVVRLKTVYDAFICPRCMRET